MAHPPIPLPKVKKRARDEGERLDAAKRSIVEETGKQRVLLIEKEQELERLKKESKPQ
ncbi:hypothetical protein BS47DRAFT_1354635 [Hydnum rufescens UP504]|uniref:Uncharacterized protein n=1 Tax=Hydnum rufescens UP504 TaxID=1448309 RepID=A0A9P6AFP6_9AGAM|nr:hypothetical protein BS47DRAFT_1354635 [Hydnum rufescens UP504]